MGSTYRCAEVNLQACSVRALYVRWPSVRSQKRVKEAGHDVTSL